MFGRFCPYGGSDAGSAGVDGLARLVIGLVLEASVERDAALCELEGALGRAAVAAARRVAAAVQDVLKTWEKAQEPETTEQQDEQTETKSNCGRLVGQLSHCQTKADAAEEFEEARCTPQYPARQCEQSKIVVVLSLLLSE